MIPIMKSLDEFLDSKINSKIEEMIRTLSCLDSNINSNLQESVEKLKSLESKNHSNVEEIMGILKSLVSSLHLRRFRVEGEDSEMMIDVTESDSIVQIKKIICEKLSVNNKYNYKMMKLKYNEQILNDNEYLLSVIGSGIVTCAIDQAIDPKNVLIIKQSGNTNLPKLIQVTRNKTIAELKASLKTVLKFNNFTIFKDKKELKNDLTIENYIKEDDEIIEILRSMPLILNSIFGNKQLSVEHFNSDNISSIAKQIAVKVKVDSKAVILFYNEYHLDEEKFLFDYKIDDSSNVKYFYPTCLENINIMNDNLVDKELISNMYWGKYEGIKENVLVKQYKKLIANLVDDNNFLQVIKDFHLMNTQPGFTETIGIHRSPDNLLVAMKYMEGSLNNFLKSKILENKICKWTLQIMRVLKSLHDLGHTYGGLTPYNILFDKDENIKLASFILSKYFHYQDINETFNVQIECPYMSPEIKRRLPYERSADVWSLGVLLIHMVNGKLPKIEVNEINGSVKYNFKHKVSSVLKEFIDSCVKCDPDQRASIDMLLDDKFIKIND